MQHQNVTWRQDNSTIQDLISEGCGFPDKKVVITVMSITAFSLDGVGV